MPSVVSAHMVMWVYAPPPDTSSREPSPQRTRERSVRCVPGVRYASTPMMGLMSWALAWRQKSKAPKRKPWSLVAMELMPSSLA